MVFRGQTMMRPEKRIRVLFLLGKYSDFSLRNALDKTRLAKGGVNAMSVRIAQRARSLFLENFMNSSSEMVVSARRMVAMAEASPSLPCVTRL